MSRSTRNARRKSGSPRRPPSIAQSLQDLSDNPLGIELSRERAVEMRCGERDLIFLFTRDYVEQGIQRAFEKKVVAGVVAVRCSPSRRLLAQVRCVGATF